MVSECVKDLYQIKKALIVILIPLVLLPLPLIDGTQKSACGYVILIMAVFWITEALPIAVTSLIPVFMFPIVGLLSVKEASQQYFNNKSMLLVGSFIVAAAVERWDIHGRIALRIMLLFGTQPRWLLLGIMVPTWFISFWICNCSSTALMLPIAYALLIQLRNSNEDIKEHIGIIKRRKKPEKECCNNMTCRYTSVENTLQLAADDVTIIVSAAEPLPKENLKGAVSAPNGTLPTDEEKQQEDENSEYLVNLGKAFTLGVTYAANVGGVATMTGSVPNLIFVGFAESLFEKYGLESPITYANWMAYGIPTSFVLVIFVWIWLQVYFLRSLNCCSGNDKKMAGKITKLLKAEYEELGPITFAQGVIIVHFVTLILLWITRDMGGQIGWGHIFKDSYIKEAVPVVIIASILFVFPSKIPRIFCCRNKVLQPLMATAGDKREEPIPLMSWKYAVDRVPWGVIFLLGSGFCIAKATKISGLSAWMGSKLSGLEGMEPWVLCLVLCYLVTAMTEVISNAAVCTLMMPLISALAIGAEINPLHLMFPAAMTTSFAFMLPAAAPPNGIAFSYGYVKVRDMVFSGFLLNIVCVLVLMGSTETIGQALFDFHTMPKAFLDNRTLIDINLL